ncbi:50S ribosomal protein L18e, partial [Candidatus Micrarchaeota archaeon]|nr:50S ribosomal protein L18e [Candidatus Micrarchaeota archaeon]
RKSAKQGKIWDSVADLLEAPSRKKKTASFARLNRITKDGETIVLCSKLLSKGNLNHSLTIACFDYSNKAKDEKNAKLIGIKELVTKNPKGSGVRIVI